MPHMSGFYSADIVVALNFRIAFGAFSNKNSFTQSHKQASFE